MPAALRRLRPVSYTHLDVYKRQAEDDVAGLLAADQVAVLTHVFGNVLVADGGLFIADTPVSYTHLDVYKRQHQQRIKRR